MISPRRDDVDEKRLDRIETKLDELTKVVTDLARIKPQKNPATVIGTPW